MGTEPNTRTAAAARFVDMVAWTLALLGGYGVVRFAFMAIRELREVPALPQPKAAGLAAWLELHTFGVTLLHCLLCIGIVVLAIALLWRRAWSRPAMVAFGMALALYLLAWSVFLAFGRGGNDQESSAWEMVQWVIAAMLLLLAAMAGLLARRFAGKSLRDFFTEQQHRTTN